MAVIMSVAAPDMFEGGGTGNSGAGSAPEPQLLHDLQHRYRLDVEVVGALQKVRVIGHAPSSTKLLPLHCLPPYACFICCVSPEWLAHGRLPDGHWACPQMYAQAGACNLARMRSIRHCTPPLPAGTECLLHGAKAPYVPPPLCSQR